MSMTKEVIMETDKDRFVTPGLVVPALARSVGVHIPALNDDCIIYLDVAPQQLDYNYPKPSLIDYATEGVALEFRFDDADGTRILDEVHNLSVGEQGDPTYAQSAATQGLGNGVTFDGTGDAFDILTSSLPPGSFPTVGDFSVEMVLKLTSGSGGAADTLMALRNGAAGVGFALQLDANEHLDVVIEDADGTVTMNTTTDIATGNIVHLVVDFDRDANITAFINGAAVTTAASIAAVEKTIFPGIGAACRLSIGGDAARTAGSVITGTVYFARLYNKILGADGALDNYNILIGNQHPGWSAVYDFINHVPLQVITANANDNPAYVDLTPFMSQLKSNAIRLRCATEQTTSPTDLKFLFSFS